ncbi:DL-glycerol-3-phosphatase [Coemansia pectinata]|uniref:DL-glycerol-3-phosphatase n=1 Tax=Coemansia pectinata TaxID=1052879 RepID=A0A9W8GRU5_9FUNG|nr:DL-glycerol-3-phosphatase [Coemansia pectinata]
MSVVIKAKGILFDMDGTLVDTTACVEQAWRTVALEYGVDPTELIKNIHGRSGLDTLRTYFPAECHTPEFLRSYEAQVVEQTEGVEAVPGALTTLSSLHADKWAVVTAASAMWAQKRLSQAGLPMPKHLVSADSVKVNKPHPEGYLAGARHLGLDAKDTVVFEDAVSGVLAGRAANATVIALTTSTPRKDLIKAGAHYVLDDYRGITFVDRGDHLTIEFKHIDS